MKDLGRNVRAVTLCVENLGIFRNDRGGTPSTARIAFVTSILPKVCADGHFCDFVVGLESFRDLRRFLSINRDQIMDLALRWRHDEQEGSYSTDVLACILG